MLEAPKHSQLEKFLFDTSRTTVVTYDDTYSLADKAAYVHNQGMGGCFTWSLDQVCAFLIFNHYD